MLRLEAQKKRARLRELAASIENALSDAGQYQTLVTSVPAQLSAAGVMTPEVAAASSAEMRKTVAMIKAFAPLAKSMAEPILEAIADSAAAEYDTAADVLEAWQESP